MDGYRKMFYYLKDERGSLLYTLLLFSAALLILGAAFLKESFNERIIAKNYLYKIKSHYVAEAGMELALTLLREDPEYFLREHFAGPYYLGNGTEEEYFVLEWLGPVSSTENTEIYTLESEGYSSLNPEEKPAKTTIKASLLITYEIEKGNNNEEENTEGESSEEEGYEEKATVIKITMIELSGR
ncbi:MAG: hypothetical protein GX996_08880 [Firmicutes bacterium]|nr:hypothetical protein [Bacillota bacterium]